MWLALAIPFVFTTATYLLWPRKVAWWELGVPFIVSLGMILGFKTLGESAEVTDTEYWTGWVEKAEYYEHWNEKVACRHPHYKTVTKTRPKTKTVSKTRTVGAGKNARTETYTETVSDGTETYTEQVQDGWEHPFDVDDHPAYWQIHDNTGHTESISSSEFERLSHKFGSRQWVNLHRDYYSINGNKYVATFPGDDARLESTTHTHSYENRIQANTSSSIFKFRKLEPGEKEQFNIFDYPEVKGHTCAHILGYNDPAAEQLLQVLNARLGKAKQIRVWITVYRNQPLEAAVVQESYWQGGNKNELVLAIGIDSADHVQWGYVYSWTPVETVKVECRNEILEQQGKKLDLSHLIHDIRPIIERKWERRHFKEFKYIDVEPPTWCYWVTYLGTLFVNVGLCWWIVGNGIDADGTPSKLKRRSTGFTGRTYQ